MNQTSYAPEGSRQPLVQVTSSTLQKLLSRTHFFAVISAASHNLHTHRWLREGCWQPGWEQANVVKDHTPRERSGCMDCTEKKESSRKQGPERQPSSPPQGFWFSPSYKKKKKTIWIFNQTCVSTTLMIFNGHWYISNVFLSKGHCMFPRHPCAFQMKNSCPLLTKLLSNWNQVCPRFYTLGHMWPPTHCLLLKWDFFFFPKDYASILLEFLYFVKFDKAISEWLKWLNLHS